MCFYYINTNEIPSELLCENMVSSHVKRSLLLWLHTKMRLSMPFAKRFSISLVFEKYFAALTHEIFFNTPREISNRHAARKYPLFPAYS